MGKSKGGAKPSGPAVGSLRAFGLQLMHRIRGRLEAVGAGAAFHRAQSRSSASMSKMRSALRGMSPSERRILRIAWESFAGVGARTITRCR